MVREPGPGISPAAQALAGGLARCDKGLTMRIGLLGGAFDPPHNAHLEIARRVREAHSLDRVDLLVSGQSPHAECKYAATSAAHRLAMTALAVANQPGLGVDDRETSRPGKSYTVETLRELRSEKPSDTHYFIIGGDMLASLPQN